MDFRTIIFSTEGPLAWIRLNRPDKLNAISKTMLAEINQAMDLAQLEEGVRVILLSGEGRAFSAGFDLEPEAAGHSSEEEEAAAMREELRADFDMIMRFWDSPKPTVAAIHGYCLGGALELAAACDVTIAAKGSRLGEPEVKFGSGIVAMILPWLVGPKRAKEILLTGNDRISAEQAEAWGLVNRVVEAEQLMDQARDVARAIARNDQLAVRLTKQAVNRSFEIGRMREALEEALEFFNDTATTETEESRQFNEILREEGAKAAIAWRDRRLG
jgi:enoyl-CoA hydratase